MDNKKKNSMIMIYAIIFILYNILFWVIPFPKNISSVITYIFTLAAIILSGFITDYAFKNTQTLKSKVYGFPIFRVGYIYLIAQVTFSVMVYLLNIFIKLPVWIAIVVSVIFLAMVLAGVILIDNTRDVVEEVEKKTEIQTRKMTYFRLDVAGLVDFCKDGEVKKKLAVLSEDFKYSDPVSNPELVEIEDKITKEVEELRNLIAQNDTAAMTEKIGHITILLKDRNRRCKALK